MMFFKKLGWALKGIKETFKSELSFKLEILGGIFLFFFAWLAWPLKTAELFALLIAYLSVLILELVNTSIESILTRLHPEKHDLIAKAKDSAAGAVLLSILLTIIIALVIFLSRFGILVLA